MIYRVEREYLQYYLRLSIMLLEASIMLLESSITLLENIYSTGITHDDCNHNLIVEYTTEVIFTTLDFLHILLMGSVS